MPFDNQWQHFPASKPLEAKGGIATTKARGAMADTWWSKRFVTLLDSYGLGGRMTRGRAYARKGQVLSLDVSAGILAAQVQGSRSRPYVISINIATPSAGQWRKIEGALQSRLGYAANLLAGEVPTDLEDVFASVGVRLFPTRWTDMKAVCSCPDWGDPCKHQAAVLYVFADQLDRDPWQLLVWQGRSQDQILALFAGHATADVDPADEIAPWWPLRPGVAVESTGMQANVPPAEEAVPPHAVLARLGDLDATSNALPLVDAVKAAYSSDFLAAVQNASALESSLQTGPTNEE